MIDHRFNQTGDMGLPFLGSVGVPMMRHLSPMDKGVDLWTAPTTILEWGGVRQVRVKYSYLALKYVGGKKLKLPQ